MEPVVYRCRWWLRERDDSEDPHVQAFLTAEQIRAEEPVLEGVFYEGCDDDPPSLRLVTSEVRLQIDPVARQARGMRLDQ